MKVFAEAIIVVGKSNWRKQKMSSFYDYPLIEHRLSAMRKHARNGDIDSMTLALRAGKFFILFSLSLFFSSPFSLFLPPFLYPFYSPIFSFVC
jgi:hypothetical protein